MAFKILRKNYYELDIHRTWIFACTGIADSNGWTEYKQARFFSPSDGPGDLIDWFMEYSYLSVCMEPTGKYWIPVFNILEKTYWVTLTHPKCTKPQKGNKTDHKDAKWICDLYMRGMAKPSFTPPSDVRQFRDLMRYRIRLTDIPTGEKNRTRNCFIVSSLKLDDVFSDVFGKSLRSIIQYTLGRPGEQFDVASFIHRCYRHPVKEIQAAVDGVVPREQTAKLKKCLLHIDQLNARRGRIEAEILRLAGPYPYQLESIRTVPGLAAAPLTAVALISEIDANMSVSLSAKHLASWAGCCPRNDRGSKKMESTRIFRTDCYLKPLLVQIVNVVIKSDRHPECRERYCRIKTHRGHKKAITAVCRILLAAIQNVLSKLESCSARGYFANKLAEHSVVISKAEDLALLRKRGYIFKDELAVESG